MKKVFLLSVMLFAVLILSASVFAGGRIWTSTSSYSTAGFWNNQTIYAKAAGLTCKDYASGATISYTGTVYFWVVNNSTWATTPPSSNLIQNSLASSSATIVSPGTTVTSSIWPPTSTYGYYDLLMTFKNDGKFFANRTITSGVFPSGKGNCSDIANRSDSAYGFFIVSSCPGAVALALSPTSTTPGASVTATISGVSDCAGKTVNLRNTTNCVTTGNLISSFTIGATGGTGTFIAPPNTGTHSITACVDRTSNGWANGTGESDTKTLTVSSPSCSGTAALSLAPNPADPGTPVTATLSGLSTCNGKTSRVILGTDCITPAANPCNITVSGAGGSCSFTAPGIQNLTTTYSACVDKNNDGIYSFAEGERASTNFNTTSGWTPPAGCTGSLLLALSNTTLAGQQAIAYNATGLQSDCSGKTLYIKYDACVGGQNIMNYAYNYPSGSGSFTARSTGMNTIFACLDKNNDGDFGDEGEYAYNVINMGGGAPDGQCEGVPTLSANPTTVLPGGIVNAELSGLSGCNDYVFYIFDRCDSQTTGYLWDRYQGPSTNVSFTVPQTPGTYPIQACIDKDDDEDFLDINEASNSILLSVQSEDCSLTNCAACAGQASCGAAGCDWTGTTCEQPTTGCTQTNLGGCTDQASCTAATGNWCNNACQAAACGAPCSNTNLGACTTQVACGAAGGNWCNNACQAAACGGALACSSSNLPGCASYPDCLGAGGNWCNGVCQASACASCSRNACNACQDRTSCEFTGCYWYNSACTSQTPPCTGAMSVSIADPTITPNTRTTGTVAGLRNCDGKIALVKIDSCDKPTTAQCEITNGSCRFSITSPGSTGNYTYAVCVDRNEDNAFAPAETVTTALAVRPESRVAGFPEWVFFLIISIVIASVVGILSLLLYKKKKRGRTPAFASEPATEEQAVEEQPAPEEIAPEEPAPEQEEKPGKTKTSKKIKRKK